MVVMPSNRVSQTVHKSSFAFSLSCFFTSNCTPLFIWRNGAIPPSSSARIREAIPCASKMLFANSASSLLENILISTKSFIFLLYTYFQGQENLADKILFHYDETVDVSSHEFWLIILIVVIFFTCTKWFFDGYTPNVASVPQTGTLLTSVPFPSQQSLQVESLHIVTPTPPGPTIDLLSCDVPLDIERNLPQLLAVIRQKFGIILGGDGLTLDKARLTFESMCLAFKSSAYQKNLNSLQYPIKVNFINKGQCFAYTYANPPHSDLWEPCSALIDEYILIHELTHEMQMGASLGRDAHWGVWQQVWKTEKNHRIPTGPCVYEDPGDGGECEADAIAEYIYYKIYRNGWTSGPPGGQTLSNYPLVWPKWYTFAKTQIFGGVEY